MKLYLAPASPNCRKVRATISHLGMDLEIQEMDLIAGELQKPEFLSLNPNGLVPTLVDGDLTLWESTAVMQYLCDSYGETSLFPKDLKKRMDVVRWQCWELAHFNHWMGTIVWEQFAKPTLKLGEPDEPLVKRATEQFHVFAKVLNTHLEGKTFVTGGEVTLADFSIACLMPMAKEADVPLSAYERILAWYERLCEVPAWQDAIHTVIPGSD